jgi:hypothetical protein
MKRDLDRFWKISIDNVQGIDFLVDGANGVPDSNASSRNLVGVE